MLLGIITFYISHKQRLNDVSGGLHCRFPAFFVRVKQQDLRMQTGQ